jgi:hypothetical protein
MGEKGAQADPDFWFVEAGAQGADDLFFAYLILITMAIPMIGATIVLRRRARLHQRV